MFRAPERGQMAMPDEPFTLKSEEMLKISEDAVEIAVDWQRAAESAQTARDRERIEMRLKRCHRTGPLIAMRDLQKGRTMNALLREALTIAKEKGAERPDRIARRYRLGILCWFCDNNPGVLNPPQVGVGVGNDDKSEYRDPGTDPEYYSM
jgi:hypothetical protein